MTETDSREAPEVDEFPPVEVLLPHSHPMILVDRLVSVEGNKATASVTIRPDSPLVDDKGCVSSLVAIEYMAQSIGLLTGYRSFKKNAPIQVGYLLGTRNLELSTDHFSVGDELLIDVDWIFGQEEIGAFLCHVLKDGQPVATATLNVVQDREHSVLGRS